MPYENEVDIHSNTQNNTAARIFLQPIASPSILGLYGFAGATFMVAANMAHWFGNDSSGLFLFPFAAMFGGIAQFLASMWAYRARDGVATAMHGLWGSFWIAYGVLNLLFALGRLTPPTGRFPELGYWFIIAAAITWAGAGAAGATNKAVATTLTFLAAGSTAAAIGDLAGVEWLMILAGYLFMISAVVAWYTATGLMVNDTYGREVWKLGVSQNVRGLFPVTTGMGETGVIRGQA